MKKILVTGATGRVGANLTQELLKKNYAVKALILPDDPKRSKIEQFDIEIVAGNLIDMDVCKKAIYDVDGVIHTANLMSPLPGMSQSQFFDCNVRGTYNLFAAAAEHADKIEKFVHFSSSSVYPVDSHILSPCYTPVDENHPKRPMGAYALSKMLTEVTAETFHRENNLRVAIIRPAGIAAAAEVLGRWSVGFVAGILKSGQAHPKSDLYMADGTQLWKALERDAESADQLCIPKDSEGRPWLYQLVDVRDIVLGAILALERPESIGEAFNIAAPLPISFAEAATYLAEKTGKPILEYRLPVRWVYSLDITKAKSLLGYQPKCGYKEMLDTGLAFQRGEDVGVIPA